MIAGGFMVGDHIRRIRIKKGMSQEELAARLHVVRQTVSKWELGRSVPDAEAVVKIAELLDVSVGEILGVEKNNTTESLSEELAKANELIAEKARVERTYVQVEQKRGLLILLSFLTLAFVLIFRNQAISLLLVSVCILTAGIILYRNLALLTGITTDDTKIGILKLTTVFNLAVFALGVVGAVLLGFDVVKVEDDGRIFAMLLVSCVMIFSGIVSPKLPFTRHTGLRLPWTVLDEDVWNVAHRAIGFTALPVAVLYIAGTLSLKDFEIVTLCAVIAWIGLPALISYIYYNQKTHGKR